MYIMSRMTINLNRVEDIHKFVAICSGYEEDIDVYYGRLTIDGKSIMGVMSLDLSRNIDVSILTEDEKVEKEFYEKIKRFEVKE